MQNINNTIFRYFLIILFNYIIYYQRKLIYVSFFKIFKKF